MKMIRVGTPAGFVMSQRRFDFRLGSAAISRYAVTGFGVTLLEVLTENRVQNGINCRVGEAETLQDEGNVDNLLTGADICRSNRTGEQMIVLTRSTENNRQLTDPANTRL